MIFRVPLILERSIAVIHRLNPDGTDDSAPADGVTSGYDDVLEEPVVYDTEVRGLPFRREARVEYPPLRVPCQVEPIRTEDLQQFAQGNSPKSDIVLVFHRMDLERMRLINPDTNELILKENDRVSAVESPRRPGAPTYHLREPGLYIFQLQPRSFGFGPKGTDLIIAYISEKQKARV